MLEVAEFGICAGKFPGAQIRLAGPTFPRGYGTTNPIFFDLLLLYLYSTHQYKPSDIYMLYIL